MGKKQVSAHIYICVCVLLIRIHVCVCVCVCVRAFACNYLYVIRHLQYKELELFLAVAGNGPEEQTNAHKPT